MATSELREVIRGFRREQVVTTALKIFGRTGAIDASLEDIAAEAGISRSTIYNHFTDRGELLAACATFTHGRFAAAMQRAVDGDGDAETVLTRFYAAALACLDENPGFYRLATSLRSSRSVAEAVLDDELAVASTRAGTQIDRLVSRLSGDLGADVADATFLVGVVLLGALEQRAQQVDPPPATETASRLACTLLSGISVGPTR